MLKLDGGLRPTKKRRVYGMPFKRGSDEGPRPDHEGWKENEAKQTVIEAQNAGIADLERRMRDTIAIEARLALL
ncbi:hypothetical protein L6452_41284 [Arctium lappa]|uniref:Uncharacterized protein n=1 Tax=Arctium lappa TaxID=4217 RepID=A0ACB8XPU1_ARCLA|nr:hypothetical protein L6452_41284 [Arctium lappa]